MKGKSISKSLSIVIILGTLAISGCATMHEDCSSKCERIKDEERRYKCHLECIREEDARLYWKRQREEDKKGLHMTYEDYMKCNEECKHVENEAIKKQCEANCYNRVRLDSSEKTGEHKDINDSKH